MKKIYHTPNTDVTTIHATHMLALSFDKNATGADENVVLTREQKTTSSGVGGGLWSDMN